MKFSKAGTIPEQAVQEYASGDTQETIAERYGVGQTAVSKFMQARKIKMRVKGGKPKAEASPAIPPFRSGICDCGGKGYFRLADGKMPCPRCSRK